MEAENKTPLTVAEMLRLTGTNNATFMEEVAKHVDTLESTVVELRQRVAQLEKENGQQ